jgi:hypothetical protein
MTAAADRADGATRAVDFRNGICLTEGTMRQAMAQATLRAAAFYYYFYFGR